MGRTWEGFPLVLIHGIPTGPRLWREALPLIVGARCLAWEMVGYGESIPEGGGRDISVRRQADYLARWMRHLGLEGAILAGHDLGGGVAQIVAVEQPETCAGLFLTNSIGYDSWPIPSVATMRALSPLVRRMPNFLFRQIFTSFLVRGHDDAGKAREAINVHWRAYEQNGGAAAFARQIDALNVNDTLAVAARLSDIRVPARIVWGAADRFQKIAYGEKFARDLKAPLRRIETARHFTPEDHPDVISEELNRLIADVARR